MPNIACEKHSLLDIGITGLNPVNLLLTGSLVSCVLHGLFDHSLRRFCTATAFLSICSAYSNRRRP